MVNKLIEINFSEYSGVKETRKVSGKELAKIIGIDTIQYKKLDLPEHVIIETPYIRGSFIPPVIISKYTLRPEKILSDEYSIVIPEGLETKINTLCNSGDILFHKNLQDYYLYLGKFEKKNVVINLNKNYLHSELLDNEVRGLMERFFSPANNF